jgi:hypothetical protein
VKIKPAGQLQESQPVPAFRLMQLSGAAIVPEGDSLQQEK